MKRRRFALQVALTAAAFAVLGGCGDSEIKPPPQAVMKNPSKEPPPKPTTKEEKIAAINKAAIPEDQKKAEIAKVNAGQD